MHSIDRESLIRAVKKSVMASIVPSLFPDRKRLWESIHHSTELDIFIGHQADKYLTLYEKYSKGKNKYANLFLAWLDVIRNFTCKSKQTEGAKKEWELLATHTPGVSESTQSTLLACILHAVQEGIQIQMANHIDDITENSMLDMEKVSDHTALYRISGWAVKSAITFLLRKNKGRQTEEVQLLKALKRSKAEKLTLPTGAQFLDRGGLTFVKSELLPWLCKIEEAIKKTLNQEGYKKYGRNIFRVGHAGSYVFTMCVYCMCLYR